VINIYNKLSYGAQKMNIWMIANFNCVKGILGNIIGDI
jgi:hypothetical protein